MRIILAVAASMLLFSSCQKICPMCSFPDKNQDNSCSTDLKKGLLAYYPFNGNFKDESGNGLDAVAYNGASLGTSLHGHPNSAAAFDGQNDYLMVNDNGKLSTDSVTVSVWVLTNSLNRAHGILSRVNFDDTRGVTWGVGQTLDLPNRWQFGVPESTLGCDDYFTYQADRYVNSTQAINKGQWYNVVASFAHGEQKIYIDGVLKATIYRDFQSLRKCTNNQLVIGGWWKNDLLP
ncbi:MAG: LamG domain-containing protein, partial [Flavitalea sp.]